MASQRRTPGSQASLREANRRRVIHAIKKHGSLTQVELAGVTGLSQATISNIVREMTGKGVLHTTPSTRSGRRASLVTFSRALGLVAGIHVTARHLRIILADVNGAVLGDKHMPLARDHRPDNELNRATLLVSDMLAAIDSDMTGLVGAGLAVDAPVVADPGRIVGRGILRGWVGVDVAASLEGRLRCPVFLDNASNLAALAEMRRGAARGKQDVVYIDLGQGIGAGLIMGGTVFRGHRGLAGEFGHTVIEEDGPACRCGNRGCLEAVAGGKALIDALETDGATLKLVDVVLGAVAGDARSIRALADAGRHIGMAAGNLCNLVDPERVVVGGELARAGEVLLGPIRQALERTLVSDPGLAPEVVQAQLGLRAAATGAFLHAIDGVNMRALAS